MPELPEVITIRNDLRNVIQNKCIKSIETYEDYPLTFSKSTVLGHSIRQINNIAKLLTIELSSGYFIVVHLRMTGNLLYNHKDKYIKVKITFEDDTYLNFSIIRKFGYLKVWDRQQLEDYSKRFGKSLLESDLTRVEFVNLISKRKAPIKNALLNQKIVSGIGNIYASDALYLAKIHPRQPSNTINIKNLELLFDKLKYVLNLGVKNRGSSFDRYRDIYGKKGNHQNHFLIYGKKDQVCTQCGEETYEYSKMSGRGTFHCPNCQRIK